MIEFNEETHSYTANGERYISSTTLIGKFKTPFDSLEIATKVTSNPKSEYFGRNIDEVIAEWKKKGDDACIKGTAFHKKKEAEVLGFIPESETIKRPITIDYSELEDGLYAELLLWNSEYKLAGQADLVKIETKGLKRYVSIYDHKTNKEIKTESYKHPRNGYQMMQGCCKHLQDCNLNHYTLQLSLYAWMMEQHGFIPKDLEIHHYPDIEAEGIVYKLNYMKSTVVDMLKHYKKNNK